MKFCPYCLAMVVGRGFSALYCCEEHARAARRQEAAGASRLRTIYRRIDEKAQQQAFSDHHFREIAMGRDVDGEDHAARYFNVVDFMVFSKKRKKRGL